MANDILDLIFELTSPAEKIENQRIRQKQQQRQRAVQTNQLLVNFLNQTGLLGKTEAQRPISLPPDIAGPTRPFIPPQQRKLPPAAFGATPPKDVISAFETLSGLINPQAKPKTKLEKTKLKADIAAQGALKGQRERFSLTERQAQAFQDLTPDEQRNVLMGTKSFTELEETKLRTDIAAQEALKKQRETFSLSEAKGAAFQNLLTDIEKKDILRNVGKASRRETIPTAVKTFEIVTGINPGIRGSSDYKKAFLSFRKETQGREQIVGATPDGQLIKFNTIDGKISSVDAPTLIPKTKKIVSGETASQIGVMDSIIEQLGDIKNIAKLNPQFIGPIEGKWNQLKSSFVNNPDFTLLDRNVASLITLAYAQSGKQISEREMQMLKAAILPSVTQPDANFEVALDFAIKWLTSNRDNRINRLKEFGFFTGKERKEDLSTLSDAEFNKLLNEQVK